MAGLQSPLRPVRPEFRRLTLPFDPPKTAGGHPRLVLALLAAILLAVGAVAVVRHFSPTPEAAADQPVPPRPPLVVVEDLPRLSERLNRSRFTGGVLVARGDEVIFRQVYGQTEGRPLALDDRFRLASISKQFTAAAILKLQDAGKLSVDDPLCKWIDPCPEAWAPIRLHHLLSHTSGVPDLMSQSTWGQRRIRPTTPEQLTAANVVDIFKTCDVCIDGTDHLATKFLLNDAAVLYRKPLIQSSIHQFEGQIHFYQPEDQQASCP